MILEHLQERSPIGFGDEKIIGSKPYHRDILLALPSLLSFYKIVTSANSIPLRRNAPTTPWLMREMWALLIQQPIDASSAECFVHGIKNDLNATLWNPRLLFEFSNRVYFHFGVYSNWCNGSRVYARA